MTERSHERRQKQTQFSTENNNIATNLLALMVKNKCSVEMSGSGSEVN
jgi:hypothetical protein